jgi:hypothetical protein
MTVSDAFWKSTKQANSLSFAALHLSIIVFNTNMWSEVLASFVNPI